MKRKNLKLSKKALFLVILIVGMLLGLILFHKQLNQFAASKLAQKMKQDCFSKIEWGLCYGKELSQLNEKVPFSFSMTVLKALQQEDPQTDRCHLIAHKLAGSEVAKNPDQWLSMFKHITNSNMCFTGFIHGAIEGKQRYEKDFKVNRSSADDMCNQIMTIAENDNPYPCGHGIGHLILIEQNGDLAKSTEVCSSLDKKLTRSCLDGLFMEYFFKSNLVDHGMAEPINLTQEYAQDMENVCKMFKGEKAAACWREMAPVYYKLNKPGFAELLESCHAGVVNYNVDNCYFRGLSLIIMSPDFDKQTLSQMCTSYINQPEELSLCYDWAITGLIYTNEKLESLVDDVCMQSPDVFKEQCWKMKEDRLVTYGSKHPNR